MLERSSAIALSGTLNHNKQSLKQRQLLTVAPFTVCCDLMLNTVPPSPQAADRHAQFGTPCAAAFQKHILHRLRSLWPSIFGSMTFDNLSSCLVGIWLPPSWKLQADPQRSNPMGPPLGLDAVPRSSDGDLHINCSACSLVCVDPLHVTLLTIPAHRHAQQGPPVAVVLLVLGSNVGT